MPQDYFSVENRNHVWRDLSRLVDVESKKNWVLALYFFRQEIVGDLNLAQSGL